MKQLSFLSIALVLFSCNTATNKETDTMVKGDSSTTPSAPVSYAYKVNYSSDFEIGDAKYAQTVLQLWKDFDNNTFDNQRDIFADSVTAVFYNGNVFKGTRDSLISMVKEHRTALGTSTSSVDVITTLKPKGKEETWVCVWGTEVDSNKGKTDSIYLNENWMFDKNGKVAYMTQFAQQPEKK